MRELGELGLLENGNTIIGFRRQADNGLPIGK